jgi:hypothetical protein
MKRSGRISRRTGRTGRTGRKVSRRVRRTNVDRKSRRKVRKSQKKTSRRSLKNVKRGRVNRRISIYRGGDPRSEIEEGPPEWLRNWQQTMDEAGRQDKLDTSSDANPEPEPPRSRLPAAGEFPRLTASQHSELVDRLWWARQVPEDGHLAAGLIEQQADEIASLTAAVDWWRALDAARVERRGRTALDDPEDWLADATHGRATEAGATHDRATSNT